MERQENYLEQISVDFLVEYFLQRISKIYPLLANTHLDNDRYINIKEKDMESHVNALYKLLADCFLRGCLDYYL